MIRRRINHLLDLISGYRYELAGAGMKASSIAMAFGATLILSRGLGVDDFGRFAALQAGFYLLIALAKFGGPKLIVREMAIALKSRESELVNGLFRVTWFYVISLFGLTTVTILVISLLVPGLFLQWGHSLSLLMIVAVWAWATLSMWDALTRGFGRVLIGQAAELLVRPGVFLIAIALIWFTSSDNQFNLNTTVMVFSASAIIALIFSFIVFLRLPRPAGTFNIPWRGWTGGFLQFGAIGLVGSLSLQLETLLLATLATPVETAYFKVATQVGMLTTFGLGVVNLQFAPVIAGYITDKQIDNLQKIAIRSSRFSTIFAAPVFIIVLLAGSPLITLLFSAKFSAAALPLTLVVFAQLINATCGSVALILNSGGHQAWVLLTSILALVLGSVLNLILIPTLGSFGAAIAFATALIIWNAILVCLVFKLAW